MHSTRLVAALTLAALLPGAAAAYSMPGVIRIDDAPAAAAPAFARSAPRSASRVAQPFAATSLVSPDTTLNDRSVEPPYKRQADPSIVMRDAEAVAVWYDTEDIQRMQWAFSADSGRSFVDRGVMAPPTPPMRWGPDACLTRDEKTANVWVAAQMADGNTQRAIGVSRGTFVGGDVWWEPPVLARTITTVGVGSYYIPMVAIAADSSNGTLHLLYGEYADEFGLTDIRIRYQRSTDGGQTWSASTLLSSGSVGQDCFQPRLAVTSPGVVLATWMHVTGDYKAELRWRRSVDAGVSFELEGVVVQPAGAGWAASGTYWGYSVAAERRANAVGAGRAVLAYSESWNTTGESFLDTQLAPTKYEVEPNDSTPIATPFFIDEQLIGDLTQGTDVSDAWSTALAAGEGIQLWLDSTTLDFYEISVLSSIGERLVTSYDYNVLPFEFLAPAAGTYVVLVRGYGNFGTARSYRVRTRNSTPGPGEARDHSDIALVTLEPGAAAWSAPTRFALTPVGYADATPEVHFADDGHLYLAWWDMSLDPLRMVGKVRIARDPHLPGTPPTVVVPEAATNRSTFTAGVWRSSMASEPHRLLLATSDGRYNDADVRAISIPIGVRFGECPGDAAMPTEYALFPVSYRNANPYFSETLLQRVRGARGWPFGQIVRFNVAPLAAEGVGWVTTVRDTAAPGVNMLTHSVYFGDSALVGTCLAPMTVLGCDTLHVQDVTVSIEAPSGVTAADLDLDGHLDLVMSSETGEFSGLSFAFNDGEGGFRPTILWGDGEPSRWPVAVDLTRDGYPDLIEAVGDVIRVWANISGSSQEAADYEQRAGVALPSGAALFVAPGDFDEDGITDFIVASLDGSNGWVWFVRGNGAAGIWDETFATPVALHAGGRVNSVAIGDFNEDGIADLAFATSVFTDHGLRVMLGNGTGGRGNGTFAAPVSYVNPNFGALNPAIGDFNEDGISDIVLTLTKGFAVYLGNGAAGVGDGTFASPSYYGFFTVPGAPVRVAVADVTLDGRADLVANTASQDKIMVMAGGGTGDVGDGTFAVSTQRPVGDFPVALVLGDFVDDGIPDVTDVAVANRDGNSVTVIRGLCSTTLPYDLIIREPDAPPGPIAPELLPTAWSVGSEQTIQWTAGAAIGAVDVEVSRDGGTSWARIASGVLGDSFLWTVTAPGSENAVIRVRDSAVQGWADATASALRLVDEVVGVETPKAPGVAAFALASPNPAHGDVDLSLALPRTGEIAVEVFDVGGRHVATLARGTYRAGVHPLRWQRTAGNGAGPGVYFVRARGEGFDLTRRVVRQ